MDSVFAFVDDPHMEMHEETKLKKQSLSKLKRDLVKAQRDLIMAQNRVKKLEEAVAHEEIKQIEKELGRVDLEKLSKLFHSREGRLAFFADQRETLATIIHNHPACAYEAQNVLDQILILITHISDEAMD